MDQAKPEINPWHLNIHQLDVGQGDSAIVTFSKHQEVQKVILIDGGRAFNSEAIHNYLSRLGSKGVIDAVIITHFDDDHWKGIERLKKKPNWIRPGHTIFFVQSQQEITLEGRAKTFADSLVPGGFTVESDHNRVLGNSIWQFFPEGEAPPGAPNLKFLAMSGFVLQIIGNEERPSESTLTHRKVDGTNKNQGSISCLISFEDFYHLTSGDLCKPQEKVLKKYLKKSGVKIMGTKISHHGSPTSSDKKFVQKLQCRYTIISSGIGHKHPHVDVLNAIFDNPIQKCYLTNQYETSDFFNSLFLIEKFLERFSKFVDLFSQIDKLRSKISNDFHLRIDFQHENKNSQAKNFSLLVTQLRNFALVLSKMQKLEFLKNDAFKERFQINLQEFENIYSRMNSFDEDFQKIFEIAFSHISNITPFPTNFLDSLMERLENSMYPTIIPIKEKVNHLQEIKEAYFDGHQCTIDNLSNYLGQKQTDNAHLVENKEKTIEHFSERDNEIKQDSSEIKENHEKIYSQQDHQLSSSNPSDYSVQGPNDNAQLENAKEVKAIELALQIDDGNGQESHEMRQNKEETNCQQYHQPDLSNHSNDLVQGENENPQYDEMNEDNRNERNVDQDNDNDNIQESNEARQNQEESQSHLVSNDDQVKENENHPLDDVNKENPIENSNEIDSEGLQESNEAEQNRKEPQTQQSNQLQNYDKIPEKNESSQLENTNNDYQIDYSILTEGHSSQDSNDVKDNQRRIPSQQDQQPTNSNTQEENENSQLEEMNEDLTIEHSSKIDDGESQDLNKARESQERLQQSIQAQSDDLIKDKNDNQQLEKTKEDPEIEQTDEKKRQVSEGIEENQERSESEQISKFKDENFVNNETSKESDSNEEVSVSKEEEEKEKNMIVKNDSDQNPQSEFLLEKIEENFQEQKQKYLVQLKEIFKEEALESMLTNLMRESNSLIHDLTAFAETWNKFQNKMHIAGDPKVITSDGTKKCPPGHISIQVKPLGNLSIETKIEYEMIEKNQTRKIEDFYLTQSKAEIEALFQNYIPKESQDDVFKKVLGKEPIEKYKDLFGGELMQQNFGDELCSVIFKKKKVGKDSEEISLKLKSESSLISKNKYFYDISENPADRKWAILRKVNPKY